MSLSSKGDKTKHYYNKNSIFHICLVLILDAKLRHRRVSAIIAMDEKWTKSGRNHTKTTGLYVFDTILYLSLVNSLKVFRLYGYGVIWI